MPLSKELQIGKAGEHLVCCDLIKQGYNAFLVDQGLPYDLLVEVNGELKKVQVKTTTKTINTFKSKCIYRFNLRKGGTVKSPNNHINVDYYAFVALDTLEIAYMPIEMLVSSRGHIKQCVDFKTTKQMSYKIPKNAPQVIYVPVMKLRSRGKFIQDYSKLEGKRADGL